MCAVPLVPDVALISLETDIDETAAKNTTALKLGGGFVTEMFPWFATEQPPTPVV
jgi:hypothetical protein